jgi:hypothetical protein
MTRRIINVDEVKLEPRPASYAAPAGAKGKFDARMGEVAVALGAQKLGYNVTEIPPGVAAFPFHNHRNNEEMFFILAGNGELRMACWRHRRLSARRSNHCAPDHQYRFFGSAFSRRQHDAESGDLRVSRFQQIRNLRKTAQR